MSFEKLSHYKDLTQIDFRVLLFLLSRMDYDNFIRLTQQNIADLLKMKQQQISKSIIKLVSKKILEKEKVGTSNFYRLNPEIGWKGKPEKLNNVIDIRDFNNRNKEYQANRNKKLVEKDCPF